MRNSLRFITSILIFLLSLIPQTESINLQLRGYLSNNINYTPERLLGGGVTAYLIPEINIATPVKAYIQMGQLWASSSMSAPTGSTLSFKTTRAYVAIRDPIFSESDLNYLISVGDVAVNYSPYTLRLDGSAGSPLKKGVTISFSTNSDLMVDGCFLWDIHAVTAAHNYIWGSKMRKKIWGLELEGIYASADERGRVEDPVTKVWTYDGFMSRDSVFTIEAKKRINPNWDINIMLAKNQKQENNIEPVVSNANQIQTTLTGLGGLNIDMNTWQFDVGFDPKYRDRYRYWASPEDVYDNKVDKYQGKNGYGFNIYGGSGNVVVNRLGYEHYYKKSGDEIGDLSFAQLTMREKGYTFNGGFSMENRNYLNMHGIVNKKNYTRMNFSIQRVIDFQGLRYNTKVFWDYGKDTRYLSTTKGLYVRKQGITFDTVLPKGKLRGMKIAFTVQKREVEEKTNLDILWNIGYTTPRGLNFTWRRSIPNDIRDAGWHLDYIDNLFRVSHMIYF